MGAEHVIAIILEYRYIILIPLSFIEGPVVAFLAGALVPLGYFDITTLFIIFFARDLGFDTLYYIIGHYGNKTRFVKRMLDKIGVTEDHLNGVRTLWEKHPLKTMFFGKLAYGIAVAFMLAAGMIGMPIKKFLRYSFIVAVFQYGILITLGYVLGNAFSSVIQIIIQDIAIIIFIGAIIFIGYYAFSIRMKRKLILEEKKAETEN